MGKSEILEAVYRSQEVKDMIKSLRPVHDQEDIRQHCFLELFEKDEKFIIELHERGKLKNYIVKTLYNTAKFTRTTFSKQKGKELLIDDLRMDLYLSYKGIYPDDDGNMERCSRQVLPDSIDEEYQEINLDLKYLHWYKKEILEMYAEHGTYQKVSDLTQIPLTSVYNTVLQTRKEILKKYYEDLKK